MLVYMRICEDTGVRQESIEVDCSDTIKWLRDEINNKMNIKLLPAIPYIQPLLLVYANDYC